MGSSTKWAGIISYIAGRLYFYLIILQVPLFRVPCRAGICSTPVEVTACHLMSHGIWAAVAAKTILYPRALLDAILNHHTLPCFSNLLNPYKSSNHFDQTIELHHIEVLVGSILCVSGALLSLRPGRISLVGSSLVLWGLIREIVLGTYSKRQIAIGVYPAPLSIATILAFLSIKRDVKLLIRCFRASRPRHTKTKPIWGI